MATKYHHSTSWSSAPDYNDYNSYSPADYSANCQERFRELYPSIPLKDRTFNTTLRPPPRSRRTTRSITMEPKGSDGQYSLTSDLGPETVSVRDSVDEQDEILHPKRHMNHEKKSVQEHVKAEYEVFASEGLSPSLEGDRNKVEEVTVSESSQKEDLQERFYGGAQPCPECKPETFHIQEPAKTSLYSTQPVAEISQAESNVEHRPQVAVLDRPLTEDIVLARVPVKVAVVYDGEKKFTTTPLDIAIQEYATGAGDEIYIVAYLQHVLSPMGMKMVADMEKFIGVNQVILKQALGQKKDTIERKLESSRRSQYCQDKKIKLDVRIVPGAHPKLAVVKEIQNLTCAYVIFDKNSMKSDKKHYADQLSCQILRMRSDGRKTEVVSGLLGQTLKTSDSVTSDTSSSSGSVSSDASNGGLWARFKSFGSKRHTSPRGIESHLSRSSSIMDSSRSNSNSGTSKVVMEEKIAVTDELLDESFSFDSPKENIVVSYMYEGALSSYGDYYPTR